MMLRGLPMSWERSWILVFVVACSASAADGLETGEERRDRILAEKHSATEDAVTTKRGSSGGAKGACYEAVASPGSGQHHAGDDCMQCHDATPGSKWTVSGTLFIGGSAKAGATIEVVDCTGKKLELRTYENGNFYTTQAVGFPLKVRASKCPANAVMDAEVSNGSCNASSCHKGGVHVK
jgi:hypothetical protein